MKTLTNKPSLQRHLRKHNPERCLMYVSFSIFIKPSKTLQRFHNFSCDTCKKTFGSRKEIINHVKVHMPKIRSHICCKCAKKFASPKMLKVHEQTHKPPEERLLWPCEICNNRCLIFSVVLLLFCTTYIGFVRRFVSKSGLAQHTKNIHLKLRPYMCHLCGRSFVNKADLNEHYVTHSNQRNFLCDKCNKG